MELTLTKLTAEKNKTEQNKTLAVTRKTQNTFFGEGGGYCTVQLFLKPFLDLEPVTFRPDKVIRSVKHTGIKEWQ